MPLITSCASEMNYQHIFKGWWERGRAVDYFVRIGNEANLDKCGKSTPVAQWTELFASVPVPHHLPQRNAHARNARLNRQPSLPHCIRSTQRFVA